MDGNLRMSRGILGRLGSKAVSSRRRIIVGLKSDTCSRQVLLRLLQLVVVRGDSVLAVHVQQHQDDAFDANTFHMYEDICKSKQVGIFSLLLVRSESFKHICLIHFIL